MAPPSRKERTGVTLDNQPVDILTLAKRRRDAEGTAWINADDVNPDLNSGLTEGRLDGSLS